MTFKVDSHAFVMLASVAIEFLMRSKSKKKGGLGIILSKKKKKTVVVFLSIQKCTLKS